MALYPPIIASSMPAFSIQDGKIRIYYSLSTYNIARIDDIKEVHITVRRQSSNVNVLNNSNEILTRSFGSQQEIDKVLKTYGSEVSGGVQSINFKAEADRLFAIITTKENIQRLKKIACEVGLDENIIVSHEEFLEMIK